jgi:hypothetical protein
MRQQMWAVAIALLGLTACTTFQGLTPISPEAGNPGLPATVDSLQPTLRWKPPSKPETQYDVIIYEDLQRRPGKVAYYRERLMTPEHRVEEPLKPATTYQWSVRERRDGSTSAWSRYDYEVYLVTGGVWARNQLFRFKTPDQ